MVIDSNFHAYLCGRKYCVPVSVDTHAGIVFICSESKHVQVEVLFEHSLGEC